MIAMLSDKGMAIVKRSSTSYLSCPNALAAAICNTTACVDTLMPETTILSLSVKSLIDFTSGLRLIRYMGMALREANPTTLADVFWVRAHIVRNGGGPATAKSNAPAISASFITQ